ncbi:claspin [Ischnura elegans]|uniref:claspin n=1 Tax=Ischnura elegans TaxID=197161 RepID=UPI001ED8BCB0|nr:claspin [Ischnura elegans]
MESLIHEPLDRQSAKYADSSDDEEIIMKRSTAKPVMLDSDEENFGPTPVVAGLKDNLSQSDTDDSGNNSLPSDKRKQRRSRIALRSESEESDSDNLFVVKPSIPVSNTNIPGDIDSTTEKLTDPIGSSIAPAEVSSPPPEFNRKSLFSKSDLYDAEDSDDDSHHRPSTDPDEDSPAPIPERGMKSKSKSKKPKEEKVSKPKKSKENLQKIHSESQRMVRESRVSLPYHRPRQRTLADFLKRREHVILPVKTLKTSPTKLGAVWKTLEDKVKDAEEFYKSDSDSGPDEEEKSNDVGTEQTSQNKETLDLSQVENQDTNRCDNGADINGCDNNLVPLGNTSINPLDINKNQNEQAEIENEKIVSDVEGCLKDSECLAVVDSCNASEEGCVVPTKSENDESNSVTVSVGASELSGDINKAALDRETEEQAEVKDENFCLNSEDISDVRSAMDNMLDVVSRDENSKTDDCLDSHSKNLVLLNSSSNDFSNLFPKSETPVSHEASQMMDSSSRTSDTYDKDQSTTVNKLDNCESSGLFRAKVPSPPPLEDSESISLRLDDDTVDEAGPKPVLSCVQSMSGSLKDVTHLTTQPREEADEILGVSVSESSKDLAKSSDQGEKEAEELPRVSTPVRMLMELDEMGSNSAADDVKIGQLKNSSEAAEVNLIKLDGDPDNVIDLNEDVRSYPKKEVGVKDLMARFIKHHIPKKVACEEKKVNIGIEVLEGGGDKGPEKVKREVMTVTLGGVDPIKNASPGTERPGARLRSLREELQREIARKRDEEWAKRQQEYSLDHEETEEGGKCDLDIEEEEELTDPSSSEGEEEEEDDLEEDDVDMLTKSRPKSAYVDDEAEESDEEEEEGNEGHEDSDEGSLLHEKEEEEALNLKEEMESKKNETKLSDDVKEVDSPTKDKEAQVDSPTSSKKRKFQRFKTFDLFDSEDEDVNASDYNYTASVTSPPSTPFARSREGAQGRLSLPSPALPLTALQRYSNSPTTIGQTSPWAFTQKQLFNDEDSPKHSKDENDHLKGKSALLNLVGQSQGSEVAEDELLNLMSGAFLSRANKMSETEDDFCLNLEDTQELFDKSQSKEKVKQEEGNDDVSGKDSKNFGGSSWNKEDVSFNDENENDDDDKEITLGEDLEATMRRKKLKRLNISDDEDEGPSEDQDELKSSGNKEEDLGEGSDVDEGSGDEPEAESGAEGEETDLDEEDGVERTVEYDSEENAIVVEKRVVKKVRGPRRGLEFLEAEAELSEGEEEWEGSGDEDERGLDRMEKEEGDADKLDDDVVRRELGRIHMRQVLDEDKREVRLLQEIFLEDGELHADGLGRERKFRWKNVDNMDDGDFKPTDSGDEEKVDDDDENEEKWRRLRHEREMWLREHQQNGNSPDAESLFNDTEEDSQLLKLGRAALRRINSFPNNSIMKWLKPTMEPKEKESEAPKPPDKDPGSPDVKRPFQMLCKRGSFLARKDGTLERLAEIAMKTSGGMEAECLTSTSPVVAKTKNSRKFVFTVLSPEKKDPRANMEPPKDSSLPTRKSVKRKKKEPKSDSLSKKSKPCHEASIFQFL